MKKRERVISLTSIIIGVIFLAIVFIVFGESRFNNVSGVLLGSGTCFLTYGVGYFIKSRRFKKYPSVKRKLDIDKNDERNIMIKEKSQSKSNNITFYLMIFLLIISIFFKLPSIVKVILGILIVFNIILDIVLYRHYQKYL
ncbi:hypothetical protein [Clostridium massiliamazoniense]|uniref:hypothetical protein n=1 Tax=Clostridium massiliamazoniense TaxID=1347366 RepID=UPI0006D7D980|nr:hypothetical protein [Clostridium massiliamazoniense]